MPSHIRILLAVLVLTLAVPLQASALTPAALDETIRPKAVVIAMFEAGEFTGDFAGEAQRWIERENLDTAYALPGAANPFFWNEEKQLGLVVTNMGTVNAAASLMALGLNPHVDLTDTVFLVAGIAGGPPARTTLGSAVWTEWVVDGDLKHEIAGKELPAEVAFPGFPLGCKGDFCDDGWTAGTEVFHLNPKLVQKAFELTKGLKLADSDRAREYRALYSEKAARRAPFVQKGDNISCNTYFHGKTLGDWASRWVEKWTNGKGVYVTSAMEDSGTLATLKRLDRDGRLSFDRVLVLRTISNFDRQHDGQPALESLKAESGGFVPALENAYLVGSAVIRDVLENHAKWTAE